MKTLSTRLVVGLAVWSRLRGVPAARAGSLLVLVGALAACGGGSDGGSAATAVAQSGMVGAVASSGAQQLLVEQQGSESGSDEVAAPGAWVVIQAEGVPPVTGKAALANSPTTQADAVRLANQTTFGANEATVAQIRQQGAVVWVARQMATVRSNRGSVRPEVTRLSPPPANAFGMRKIALANDEVLAVSRFTRGGSGAVDQFTNSTGDFCDPIGPNCWRDWSSSTPLLWDFYRHAVESPDQLRQRVGFAAQQILVVSNLEVSGTYGLRTTTTPCMTRRSGTIGTCCAR
ncbi:MAG: hypothetical protein R3E56_04150 [Burkholderiaceae bacterium]